MVPRTLDLTAGATQGPAKESRRWTFLPTRKGTPLSGPEKPAADADIEVKIAYMRAVAEYNDRVQSCGSEAFARAFRP